MKTAVVLIATGGQKYFQYVHPLVDSIYKHAKGFEPFVFTDQPEYSDHFVTVPYPDLGWPNATLMRYHGILEKEMLFVSYDNILYCDIDMLLVSDISQDIFKKGITAVVHPGYPDAFDRNPASTAYVPNILHPTYYQGCLVGGSRDEFLIMCSNLAAQISIDRAFGVMAIWHDESHLNRYLIDHPPVISLPPTYAYPDDGKYIRNYHLWGDTTVRIRHIEKTNQGDWKNK